MTNEEKIKAMSREELAKLLFTTQQNIAPFCSTGYPPFCKVENGLTLNCRKCIANWLSEEAKG